MPDGGWRKNYETVAAVPEDVERILEAQVVKRRGP